MEAFFSIIIILGLMFVSVLIGYSISETHITQKLCNSDKQYDFCKIEQTTYKIEVK